MSALLIFTPEQKSALEHGQPVNVFAQDTGTEFVLIRADVFNRLKSIVLDDQPLTEAERLAAIRFAGERARWDDPELDVYEEYRKQP